MFSWDANLSKQRIDFLLIIFFFVVNSHVAIYYEGQKFFEMKYVQDQGFEATKTFHLTHQTWLVYERP